MNKSVIFFDFCFRELVYFVESYDEWEFYVHDFFEQCHVSVGESLVTIYHIDYIGSNIFQHGESFFVCYAFESEGFTLFSDACCIVECVCYLSIVHDSNIIVECGTRYVRYERTFFS